MDMDKGIVLPAFPPVNGLLSDGEEVTKLIQGGLIAEVNHYVLGPEGTNISQAALKWSKERDVSEKSNLRYCGSPEESIDRANSEAVSGSVNLAWTCAVYYQEHQLFFKCVDHNLFFAQQRMCLDCMQLVSHVDLDASRISSIATHPSPAVLLDEFSHRFRIDYAKSNAHAAQLCKEGVVDAAITTETARRINGLKKVHEFGSPEMVFFACLPKNSSDHLKGYMT